MPANEFEKQVQRQLDDFELNPSASVWKKVEEQIKKKKRRRVLVFFLLLAALLLTGYYYLMQPHKKNETVQQTVLRPNEKSLSDDKNNIPAEIKDQPIAGRPQTGNTNSLIEKKTEQEKIITSVSRDELQISSNHPPRVHKKNDPYKKGNNLVTAIQKKTDVPSGIINTTISSKPEIAVTIGKPAIAGTTNNETGDNSAVKPVNADSQKNSLPVDTKEPAVAKADSVKTNDIAKADNKQIILPKRRYKIKWGIDFSVGITSNQGEVFPLYKSADRAANVLSSPVTTFPGGGITSTVIQPSSIKPGAAFRIGLTGEKQVSPRSRFSAGLQYSYASNKIKKGGVVYALLPVQPTSNFSTTQVDQVYHGSPQNVYTNNYHFLSVPLEYQWQINKSKKLPVEWNMGLSFDYLLATNALVFNSSYGGIYYQDKKAISKMHVNIGTGLSFRLKGNGGMEWVIGPEIYFDTQKLVNNGHDARQYLLFTGVNAKLFFPKKKNK